MSTSLSAFSTFSSFTRCGLPPALPISYERRKERGAVSVSIRKIAASQIDRERRSKRYLQEHDLAEGALRVGLVLERIEDLLQRDHLRIKGEGEGQPGTDDGGIDGRAPEDPPNCPAAAAAPRNATLRTCRVFLSMAFHTMPYAPRPIFCTISYLRSTCGSMSSLITANYVAPRATPLPAAQDGELSGYPPHHACPGIKASDQPRHSTCHGPNAVQQGHRCNRLTKSTDCHLPPAGQRASSWFADAAERKTDYQTLRAECADQGSNNGRASMARSSGRADAAAGVESSSRRCC